MQCQTTLEQLRNFLSGDEAKSEQHQSLSAHVVHCDQCRSRLDWLTHDRLLADAAQRGMSKDAGSPVLQQALETIDSIFLRRSHHDTVGDARRPCTMEDFRRLLDPADDPGILGTVGRYQAQAMIGRGGMSIVFAAWDPVLDRRVAIKVLNCNQNEITWQRFAREARAVAKIEHDAVVPLYEVVERQDRPPALVMPLMSAGSLQQQLDREPIAPNRAAEIAARIATGLAEVHRHNQIHRDIKPGNILFDDKGDAKLSDFSLARRDEDEPLTEDNVLPGTPEYIAPEMLLMGGSADIRSDIYQLGLTLYAMLTGGPPYRGTVRSVLRQIVEDAPPSPSRKKGEKIPRDLETICLKAMERRPSERYENATAFADDLQRFLAGDSISARRPNPILQAGRYARRHPFTFALSGIAAPCLILLSVAYAAIQQQHRQFEQQTELINAQREADRLRLADETHRADVAQLRSDQAFSQSFSAVLATQQVREPDWVDTEKTIMTSLLGGLEQGYQQMLLAPERNPNFGEMALALAKLRSQVGKTTESMDAYEQAIRDFERRVQDEPTEGLWQHMTNARRGYGRACRELDRYDEAIKHLQAACNIAQRQAHSDLESLKWKLEWAMSETELGLALIAAGQPSESDSHLESAAIRIRAISMAERPQFDLVGFRTQFADAASDLAQAFRKREWFDRAISIQRLAIAQTDRLGDDEMSNVKRSDAYATASDLLVDANRPVAAMKALRQSMDSLNKAMQQSNFPGRYRNRRAKLQGKIRLLAKETGVSLQDTVSDRATVPTTAHRAGLVMDKRRVQVRAIKPVLRSAPE